MEMNASQLIEHLIKSYDLHYEGTCDGTTDSYRTDIIIGNKQFFGFTKDDQSTGRIPRFDLMVDLSEGLIVSIQFHRYRCPVCGITTLDDPFSPKQWCDCPDPYIAFTAPSNIKIDLSKHLTIFE